MYSFSSSSSPCTKEKRRESRADRKHRQTVVVVNSPHKLPVLNRGQRMEENDGDERYATDAEYGRREKEERIQTTRQQNNEKRKEIQRTVSVSTR